MPEVIAEARRRRAAMTAAELAAERAGRAETERRETEALAASLREQAVRRAGVPRAFREPARREEGRALWRELAGGPWCLLLWGDAGRGKTDLACAVALAAIDDGLSVLFRSDAGMLSGIRAAMDDRDDTESAAISRLCDADLLVLDDLGKARPSAWGLEKLWQVVDGRYREGRKMVLTSNLRPPDELGAFLGDAHLAQPVVSRLAAGLARRVEGPDWRLRHG